MNQEFKNLSCEQLSQEITQLRNELAKRYSELKEDIHQLPKTGKQSVVGHIQQMHGKQARLRKLLNEFNTRGCGGDVPDDAWKYATKDEPVSAEETAKSQGVSSNDMQKIVIGLGIAAGIIFAVFAAPASAGLASALIPLL